jgi:ferrous iron transport protein A
MSISELKPGDIARVTRIDGRGAVRQRLLDMGLLPDVQFKVERLAPAGDPIWISVHGFEISLRRREASTIHVVRG